MPRRGIDMGSAHIGGAYLSPSPFGGWGMGAWEALRYLPPANIGD